MLYQLLILDFSRKNKQFLKKIPSKRYGIRVNKINSNNSSSITDQSGYDDYCSITSHVW